MRVVHRSSKDIEQFDINRYLNSLKRYGKIDEDYVKEKISSLGYELVHDSVLVRLGAGFIKDVSDAERYYNDHHEQQVNFERLARITGYLVGTLDRWNDGKRAEYRERVKHSVNFNSNGMYSQEEKSEIEQYKQQVKEQTQTFGKV